MFICITHNDNQSFLANTDCPVLLLLSHLRSKVGVPPNEAIDLCDKQGSPKMLFQVKTMEDRASDFLPARRTYYVCRVEFGAPGTAQEQTAQSFVPILKNPSVALTGGCRDGNAWGGVPSLGLLQKPPVPFLVQRRSTAAALRPNKAALRTQAEVVPRGFGSDPPPPRGAPQRWGIPSRTAALWAWPRRRTDG
uniref:Chromosome X open reading frame 65 n=1 Tax=Phasianus colchicus TaxID=9054 RepID=A0A669PZA7_PHACC